MSPLPSLDLINIAEVTPEFVKTHYFHGIDLTDSEGNEVPEDSFNYHLASAKAWLRNKIGIELEPVVISEEPHDYRLTEFMSAYGHFNLRRSPIIEVTDLAFWYGSTRYFAFPQSWLRVHDRKGTVQIFPAPVASGANLAIGQDGQLIIPTLYARAYAPQMFRITYTAGFKEGMVPANIIDCICKKASIEIFNQLGDIIVGAGIANISLSLDGLSQSVGTTASATNAGYGARIIQYEKQLKALVEELRGTYKGVVMGVG